MAFPRWNFALSATSIQQYQSWFPATRESLGVASNAVVNWLMDELEKDAKP
jgi:hypothetical protein